MTWWARRRGFLGGPPGGLYRRTGARYFDACAVTIVLNGVIVSVFGVVALVLYVDLSLAEAGVFAACLALGSAIEGTVAAHYFVRAAEPARAWLAGGATDEGSASAWLAAARLPLRLVRRPSLYAIGAVGAVAVDVLVAGLLELPAYQAALLFPMSYLLYISCGVLRYVGLELSMRPVLRDIGEKLPELSLPRFARVTLHQRLLATVPMVTWGTALIVGGLVTPNTRNLDTVGLASVVACLNELYEAVVPLIEGHGGHANKFVGDGLLAVFGAPERHADHAARALAAACDIAQLVREGVRGELRIGLGVNSGRVVAGTIGGGRRRDFTVIGDPVNTAARVEAATRLTGDDILITESTLRALGSTGDDFEERPSVPLRGKIGTVCLYTPRSYRQPRAPRPRTPM